MTKPRSTFSETSYPLLSPSSDTVAGDDDSLGDPASTTDLPLLSPSSDTVVGDGFYPLLSPSISDPLLVIVSPEVDAAGTEDAEMAGLSDDRVDFHGPLSGPEEDAELANEEEEVLRKFWRMRREVLRGF